MVRLRLPEHKAPFIDPEAGREYLSAGVYEVPGSDVDEYVSAGWLDPVNDSSWVLPSMFVERPWQTVVSEIESGAFDERLDSIEAAERARTSRPSVLGAIETRRETRGSYEP